MCFRVLMFSSFCQMGALKFFPFCIPNLWGFFVSQMWPDLIQKAKDGGLDVIQTYVFWNGHEPSPGKVAQNRKIMASSFSFLHSHWLFNIPRYSFVMINVVVLLIAVVLFWGELWSGEVHKAGAASRPLCSSQDWSLCLCWVELWVMNVFIAKNLVHLKIEIS